jgi:hypothetical protein
VQPAAAGHDLPASPAFRSALAVVAVIPQKTAGRIGFCRRNPRILAFRSHKITARNSGDNSEKNSEEQRAETALSFKNIMDIIRCICRNPWKVPLDYDKSMSLQRYHSNPSGERRSRQRADADCAECALAPDDPGPAAPPPPTEKLDHVTGRCRDPLSSRCPDRLQYPQSEFWLAGLRPPIRR